MTTICTHPITDYHYATWHKCRDCGTLLHRLDVVQGQPVLVERSHLTQPLMFHEFASRSRARGGGIDYE